MKSQSVTGRHVLILFLLKWRRQSQFSRRQPLSVNVSVNDYRCFLLPWTNNTCNVGTVSRLWSLIHKDENTHLCSARVKVSQHERDVRMVGSEVKRSEVSGGWYGAWGQNWSSLTTAAVCWAGSWWLHGGMTSEASSWVKIVVRFEERISMLPQEVGFGLPRDDWL